MLNAGRRLPAGLVYLVQVSALAVAYLAVARFGLQFASIGKNVSLVWPPTGVALTAIALLGPRVAPGILAGAFIANLETGVPVLAALGIAIGNTGEALLAGYVLRRVAGGPTGLNRLKDVLALVIVAAPAGALVSAGLGVASLRLTGVMPAEVALSAVGVWWISDVLGALVVAPLFLTWSVQRVRLPAARWRELGILVAGSVACALLVFHRPTSGSLLSAIARPTLLFPFLIWAALRFGPRGASLETLLIAVLTVWYTGRGEGPFAAATTMQSLVGSLAYLEVVAVAGLILAAVVSERGLAGEELDTLQAEHRALYEASPFAIAALDLESRVIAWNSTSERLFGFSEAEVLGKPLPTIPPEREAEFVMLREKHRQGEALSGFETIRRRKDGSTVEVCLSLSPIRGHNGRLLGSMGVLEDITLQKRATATLEEQGERLRAIVAGALDAVVTMDQEGRITGWDGQAEAIFGWPRAEAVGRLLADSIIPLRYRGRHTEGLQRFLRTGEGRVLGRRIELSACRRDGGEFPVELTVTPARVGNAFVFSAFVRDLSERQQTERIQRAIYRVSEAALAAQSLQDLYSALHAIVGELMPARNFYIALFDPTTETLNFPYYVDQVDPPPSPRRLRKGLTEHVLRTGEPFLDRRGLFDALVARGEVESFGTPSVDWLGVPLKTPDRTIGVVVAQSYTEGVRYTEADRDILQFVSTQIAMAIERKHAEEALRASEAELRTLFAVMTDVIVVLDRDGRYLKIAPTNPALLSRSPDQRVGKTLFDAFPPARAHDLLRHIRQAIETQTTENLEYTMQIDGHETWFAGAVSPLTEDSVLWIARDISDRKAAEEALRQSEEQLRHAQKMEAIGQLAGGIAHDFNNLLTSVLGHAELILAELHPGSSMLEDVEGIREAGLRAAALTRQLLAFSRKQVLEPRSLDVNAVVVGVGKMLRRLIGEDVELVTDLDPALGSVRADPGQIEQVVLNLAVNARDAMPEGGRLVISTRNRELSAEELRGQAGVVAGRFVVLSVADSGIGMEPDTQQRIFEPFFTTKAVGKGTGIGLATVYGIARQSGGFVTVQSAPGQGSTFEVCLPRTESAEPVMEPALRTQPVRGSETVLVVEDEEAIRALTRRILTRGGFTTLVASGAEEAGRLARGHEGPIHLLLTDVVMPGQSGPWLAQQLRALRPEMRVLYMSGYTDAQLPQAGMAQEPVAFIQKPFVPDALVRRVREVLDGK